LKSRPQANGGRKNNSGHLPEHIEANKDNANPYLGEDGKSAERVPIAQVSTTHVVDELVLCQHSWWSTAKAPTVE